MMSIGINGLFSGCLTEAIKLAGSYFHEVISKYWTFGEDLLFSVSINL